MTVFLENARIIDPEAGTETRGNLVLDGGVIAAIGDMAAPKGAEVVDCAGKCVAPGIVDIGVKVGEPGERHKEAFRSAGLAAAAGGVTTIIARPDTSPAIDTPETLEFVTRRAAEASPVRIRHMAALTKGREGREMTEIGFLLDAGAVAFSDCDHVVADNKVLSRALTYARAMGALVIGHPQDPVLSKGAAVTSGKFASLRGLPGVSPLAERMGFDRDMALVEMTGARYHADQVTCARTLPALDRAKANGLDVTAGVSVHHVTLNVFDVGDYRTFFKLSPPLRPEDDRRAVAEALASGLIDILCSMHTPQDEESKRLPYEEAAAGAVALETFLPAALRLV
ncbi:MAG: dihydroorotase, partial [Allgaiera sp.]|nr:dihydroorotase [Allgaiera sp.]